MSSFVDDMSTLRPQADLTNERRQLRVSSFSGDATSSTAPPESSYHSLPFLLRFSTCVGVSSLMPVLACQLPHMIPLVGLP